MFKKFKRDLAVGRLVEEQLYEQVAIELAQGYRREGLWTKALADGHGDESKAKGLYIKYRVRSLSDDAEIVAALSDTRSVRAHKGVAFNANFESEAERERESLSQLVRNLDVEEFAKMISSGASISIIKEYFSGIESKGIGYFINLTDVCDDFPIHLSIKNNRIDVLEWLLKSGANPLVKNYWGKTPLDVAEDSENAPAVMLLLRSQK